MNNVASRVLHDALANSLGRILDISREQLRVSLWSAWRTGLTLEDVGIRRDACEQLQLPVALVSGRVGRVAAQVPWATLRTLRSPVVVELADVRLRFALRRDDEMEEGPGGERAWAAKQAELAAAELAALAAAAGGGDAAAAAAAAGRQGGVLDSLLRHVLSVLLNRLQLTVRRLHIEFEDPQSGTRVGLTLRCLHTCKPGEAQPASLLLAEGEGVLPPGSPAARGSIQKQLAVEGLALYWEPGSAAGPAGAAAVAQQRQGEGRGGGEQAGLGVGEGAGERGGAQQQEPRYVLLPTDAVLHAALQLSGGYGARVHVAAAVPHLPLSLDAAQAADALALSDRLAWCAARNAHAAYCPTGWRRGGPRAVPWRAVWRYAINAILHSLRGERQGVVCWLDDAARAEVRRRYVAAYRAHLERRHLEGGGGAPQADADVQLSALERQLSVADILACRHTAQRVLEAALAAASGMGTAVEESASGRQRPRRPRQPQRAPSAGAAEGASGAAAGSAAATAASGPPSLASPAGSSSAGSSLGGGAAPSAASTGGSGRRRGYLAWGLSQAAGLLRYLPYGSSGEGHDGTATVLPEPTEAELEELYHAVDFHPEEQAAAEAAARGRGGGGAAAGLHLSLDCLLSSASLLLLDRSTELGSQPQQGEQDGEGPGSAGSRFSGDGGGGGIATLELERLRLSLQATPAKTTASLSLTGLSAHDLCSDGPGISSLLLCRALLPPGSSAAAAASSADGGAAAAPRPPPPLLRLSYTADAGRAAAAAGRPGLDAERRPQMDVLVQPLRLLPRALCVARLAALLPPALPDSLAARRLAAVNGLGAEPRCAIKARQLDALGPPLDLLVKLLGVEVQLGAGDGLGSPALLLSTGPITLLSVEADQRGVAGALHSHSEASPTAPPPASQRRLQRTTTPPHRLTAAEAAARLSAAIKQRRLAARLSVAAEGGEGGSCAAPPAGASLDAAAAVEAVEQRLAYQQFELSVTEVQAAAVAPHPPAVTAAGAEAGSAAPPSGSPRQPVLRPLRLAGLLRMHRIAEDYGLPQLQAALQVDPINVCLTHSLAQLLLEALTAPASPPQPAQDPPPPAAPPAAVAAAAAAATEPARSGRNSSGSASNGERVPVMSLDLQLASLDLRCEADGSSSVQGSGLVSAAVEARLACAGVALSVQSMLDGLTVQLSTSRLHLQDLSLPPSTPHMPPPVRGSGLPHIARLLAADRLTVMHSSHGVPSAAGGGGGGVSSVTRVELADVSVEGYAGEAASFLSRLHERQATQLVVTVRDSPAATHTTVAATNLLVGHGLLLRLAALADAPASDAQPQQQQQEASATRTSAFGGGDAGGGSAAAGSPLQPEPSSLEQYTTATEQLLLRTSASSLGSACSELGSPAENDAVGDDGTAGAFRAACPEAQPLPPPQQQQQQQAETPLPEPPALAGTTKLALTSVQLADCRIVLRYQPALHPGGGGGGGEGVPGAGVPAAVHDFLAAHQDLLALDMPLLHLRLPLDSAGLAAAAALEPAEWEQSSNGQQEGGQGLAPSPPFHPAAVAHAAADAGVGSSASSSPRGGGSASGSWRPATAAAAATPPSPELTFRQRGGREQQGRQRQPGRVLLDAAQLSLTGAAVGHGRHPMLPLLQLPSAHLACTIAQTCGPRRGGSPGSSCGSGSGGSSPAWRSSGSSPQPPSDRGATASERYNRSSMSSVVPPDRSIAYRLDVPALDLGLHPSQLSMLTSALQLCQHELAVLGREPADGFAAGDTDSVVTSTSAPTEQLLHAQQQQQQHGRPAAPAYQSGKTGPSGGEAAAGAGADLDSALGRSQQAAGAAPAGGAAASVPAAPAPSQQWRLDASVGCVGVSLLGATPSSSCLKLEWHDMAASCHAGASWQDALPASPAPASPQWHARPGDSPSAGGASPAGQSNRRRAGAGLEAALSWRQLSLHVLHPRLPYMHAGVTPFAFAAGVLADGQGQDSASPPGASPRLFLPGGAPPPPADLLFQRARGPLSAASASLSGVRRNLSAGMGLAESADEFHDAAPQLSRPSQASSRYFSLAESEFEDAASELEGVQSPTVGHGSPAPLPLPLPLGSADHDSCLLLLLHGGVEQGAGPAQQGTAEGEASSSPTSASGSSAGHGSSSKRPLNGAGEGACARMTARLEGGSPEGQRAAVEVPSLALRLHAAGWEDAARCAHTYAVLAQQAQRQYRLASQARAASPLGRGPRPAADAAAAASSEDVPQQGTTLALHLQAVLLEVVADGVLAGDEDAAQHSGSERSSAGGGRSLVPACALTGELQLEARRCSDGASHLTAQLPGLLLRVGVVPAAAAAAARGHTPGGGRAAPACLALPLQDSLLGLHKLDLSLVSQQQQRQLQPAATTADGSVVVAAARLLSAGASLAQLSLWAHPRNLCAAAAFAAHARQLGRALADALPPRGGEPAASRTAGPAVGTPGEVPPPRQLTLKLNVARAAALLCLLRREDAAEGSGAPGAPHRLLEEAAPLLELAAAAVTADVRDMGQGSLEGSLRGELGLAAYSAAKAGWEPLLEPWQCRLQFAAHSESAAPHGGPQRLAITSAQGMELTVTQAGLEAGVFAGGVLAAAAAAGEAPASLAAHLEAACGSAAYSAAYWLHNETGSALDVWLAAADGGEEGEVAAAAAVTEAAGEGAAPASPADSAGSGGGSSAFGSMGAPAGGSRPRVPSGLPELAVRPGASAVLPVLPPPGADGGQPLGEHVGAPCPHRGVAHPQAHAGGSGLRSPQKSAGRLSAAVRSSLGGAGFASFPGAAPRQARSLLYFRLAGQPDICGPVRLDGGAASTRVPACPGVLCELRAAPHGGFTLTLHSGVQLRNTTQMALEVGLQTPMGLVMEPQPLGTLGPGATLWLPALRAHTGLLCVRPLTAAPPPPPALRPAASWQPGEGGGGASRMPLLAPDSLAAAAALVAGAAPERAATGGAAQLPQPRRMPSSPLLYTTAGMASPARLGSEPLDPPRQLPGTAAGGAAAAAAAAAPAWRAYDWSAAVPLQTLLRHAAAAAAGRGAGAGAEAAPRGRASRQLSCPPAAEHLPPVLLCMGAAALGDGGGGGEGSWEVQLAAPLTLHNALPVPLDVAVSAWGREHRLHLQPAQRGCLHAVDAARVQSVTLRALGYLPSAPIAPAPLPGAADAAAAASAGGSEGGAGAGREVFAADAEVCLQEAGHSGAEARVVLRHSLDLATGSHTLLFGCTLWVFNCTGVPVALRQSGGDGGPVFGDRGDGAYPRLPEDEVPDAWLPPLQLPGGSGQPGGGLHSAGPSPAAPRGVPPPAGLLAAAREGPRAGGAAQSTLSALSTPTSAAPSVLNASRVASTADMAGLSEILDGAAPGSGGPASGSRAGGEPRPVLGLKRTVSRARGIADSMEAGPAFERPSRWPGIAGGVALQRQRLRLQIRATQCRAPPGRTYWSEPVELDALGGAAVVTVPAPLLPPTASIPAARAAYEMSVTASQVPGSRGALALYLLPRYLLINTLDVPIQYKQQGTSHERELAAGASRALRWSDAQRALRLCVRVQEAGWLWSGGFQLDSPGDMFIKIRHRDRGVTMLVRVDLAAGGASGVLRVTLSHHPAGFAPYRIENCSLETLHARQHKVRDQQDVLRPYCSLHYAWDEPSLPHRLALELPGARHLGTFDLDRVGQDVELAVPAKRGEPQRRVRVLVRSEGPTRVLTVLDTRRHSLPAALAANGGGDADAQASGRGLRGPWEAWSLPSLGGKDQERRRRAKAPGPLWEVSAELAWLGVSLVGSAREVAYLRAAGLRARLAGTAAHLAADLELRRLQLDNPSPWVALPVTLQVPAPTSRLTSTVAAAVDAQPRAALTARLALWQRRPAGVVCLEEAELQLAPVAVCVEQQHVLALARFLSGMAAGLAAATAAAATAGGAPSAAAAEPSAAAPPPGGLPGLSPEVGALLSGRGAALLAPAEQKVYLDVLRIAPLELVVTFLPAPFQPDPGHPRLLALQRVLSLADVEDARLRLAALELRSPLMGASALAQLLQRHYSRALLPELAKLVGSASLLGDPVRLLHHLGLGVWSLLASPAAGLVLSARQRGPAQFLAGLASGVQGLFQNVVFALSNAATKGSTAARKAITALGLDRLQPREAWVSAGGTPLRRRLRWEADAGMGGSSGSGGGGGRTPQAAATGGGPDSGARAVLFSPRDGASEDGPSFGGGSGGVLGAMLMGVAGLAAEPIRGLDEAGLVGLLAGVKRGAVGVVVLPLASLLEMLASTADSVRRAVAGSSNVGWVRPPRPVHPTLPLEPYSWGAAMGRWLLAELEARAAARQRARSGDGARPPPPSLGAFVLCVPLAERGCYAVVTTKRVLYACAREPMWAPSVRWSAAVADLELVAAAGARLALVAQQPQRRHVVRGAQALPRALADVLRAPRPPFSHLAVDCEGAAEAKALVGTLRALRARVPPPTYIGGCLLLAGAGG